MRVIKSTESSSPEKILVLTETGWKCNYFNFSFSQLPKKITLYLLKQSIQKCSCHPFYSSCSWTLCCFIINGDICSYHVIKKDSSHIRAHNRSLQSHFNISHRHILLDPAYCSTSIMLSKRTRGLNRNKNAGVKIAFTLTAMCSVLLQLQMNRRNLESGQHRLIEISIFQKKCPDAFKINWNSQNSEQEPSFTEIQDITQDNLI